jgi:hypothetical protein
MSVSYYFSMEYLFANLYVLLYMLYMLITSEEETCKDLSR